MTPQEGLTNKIKPFEPVSPMIYAYSTPGVTYHDGWVKIGYTERDPVDRILEQTNTAGIKTKLEWDDFARYKNGTQEYFKDEAFHHYLTKEKGVTREKAENGSWREWFNIDGSTSHKYFEEFARHKASVSDEEAEYTLRVEQQYAVDMTKEYFEGGGTEFLWNAKPRFGKTLTSYDLIQAMGLKRVLIVTNRPAVSNSWADDFYKFVGWHNEYRFVSDSDAIKDRPGVMTRDEFIKSEQVNDSEVETGMIAFVSLQDLKGSVFFGGKFYKLKWMSDLQFDMLVVDEAHEGVDTILTERAFDNIHRKHTLYLSGTPYKALANERFAEDQIFNWTYVDEQEAKANWTSDEYNPYERMPRLAMFTYQLSDMIFDEIQKGIVLSDDDEPVDYAFDLNEFFAVDERNHLIHEDEIKKFLHALTTQEKYPFSTPELRRELAHTLWRLNRVESARALAKLLRDDDVFGEYEIVLAAGDGKVDEDDEPDKAYDRVKKAIATHDKTITLSVGQLTVGVTVPEWSGVLMLCNLDSPEAYMQTTFRVQNPCEITRFSEETKAGERVRKETAYVFDFDPARTLTIYDEFADKLSVKTASGNGNADERKENIERLLNFFPVLGEDSEGKMIELDAEKILSIPRRIKCQEVVRRGFMSNFLFRNISNVFGAPNIVREIVEKLTPAHEEPAKKHDKDNLSHISDVSVDDEGNAEISEEIVIGTTQDLFGPKLYEKMADDIAPQISAIGNCKNEFGQESPQIDKQIDTLVETVKETIKQEVVAPVADAYDVKKGTQNRLEKQTDREIEQEMNRLKGDYKQQTNIAKAELEKKREEAETEADVTEAENEYQSKMDDALKDFTEAVQESVQKTIEEKPQELVEQMEHRKAEKEKKTIEDTIRDHLRGFSRTIPSFIMAYGDENLTLANFDDYTEDDVFEEVTGITEEDFRFLRDGGDYKNPDTGETEHFNGHLFDEIVFDDSIEEFWNKKKALANYFDETHDEDIFDYIPPQKTNQIFTPKWVVAKMVDELEENNPGCFDDPNNTFADLYMKSGLYITEIVKRLFRSEKMKELYADDTKRVRHILREQVYGMAPTRIIYLIATNYILGFDETLKAETKNFVQADAAQAAKENRLAELVDKYFG